MLLRTFTAIALAVALLCTAPLANAVPQSGAIQLSRNGSFSNYYTSGRVSVYGIGTSTATNRFWGNICRYRAFDSSAANVICHQLSYTGASSYSYTSIDLFGTDVSPTLLNDVSCSSADFIMLFQCFISTRISSSCTDSDDISVTCYTSRIWDNPFDGQVRLTNGEYINTGLLEVYCNGQWGTVCDNTFGVPDATAVCRQLGYSTYFRYSNNLILGNTTQPIWLNNLVCSTGDRCIASCERCPGSSVTACVHAEDITITCYSPTASGSSNTDATLCAYSDNNNRTIIGATLGTFAGVIVLIIIIVVILKDKHKKGQLHVPEPLRNFGQELSSCGRKCQSFGRSCGQKCQSMGQKCQSFGRSCKQKCQSFGQSCRRRRQNLESVQTTTTPPSVAAPPATAPTGEYPVDVMSVPMAAVPPSYTPAVYPPPTYPQPYPPIDTPTYPPIDTPTDTMDEKPSLRKEEPPAYDPSWAFPPTPSSTQF